MPFWKKTDKGGKKKPPKPAVPRTAQQSIPMQRMFEDGTCRVKPNYYTRTIQYQDINYQLAQQEDKTAIFEEWCSFLNFFDSSIKFELSFVNMATDSTEFEKSIRIPYQRDGFDDVRAEYSQMLRQQLAKGNNGLTKTKFITFGVEGESMRQVKARLDHIQNDLLNNFHRLGVQAKPLNGAERLKLMHDMFNMDGSSKFHAVCEAKQSTQEEMNRLASLLPEYEVVMQMEGTGPITGPALMAEIGDVRRFKNKKALVAFAGIDAPPFQSGNFESKSRHVSKRGSPHLRRAVFLVANIILTLSHKDNSVFCFMDKKRAEGKHYYVYTIAGSAKFLRIYYARVTEYLRTQEIPVAASCLNGNS